MKKRNVFVFAVLILLLIPTTIAQACEESYASGNDYVLVDFGNGKTFWEPANSSASNPSELIKFAVEDAGFEYSFDGSTVTVDEISKRTSPVDVSWRYYEWIESKWIDKTEFFDTASVPGGSVAIGYYPDGVIPTETPMYKSSWTSIRGNSELEGHQTADLSGETENGWSETYGKQNYVNSSVLVAGDKIVVNSGGTSSAVDEPINPVIYCYNRFTGEEIWSYEYDRGAGYETASGVIVGGYLYQPSTNGHIYKISMNGPDESVTSVKFKGYRTDLSGTLWGTGPASISYYSGALYFGTSHGYVYCVDLDLNVLWNAQIYGSIYYNSPTLQDGLLMIGAWDGSINIFDAFTGDSVCNETVFTLSDGRGYVSNIIKVKDKLIFSFADGKGMNTTVGGIAVYSLTFDGVNGTLHEKAKITEYGLSQNYLTKSGSDFDGAYAFTSDGLVKIYQDGTHQLLTGKITGIKAPSVLVNDEFLVASEYDKGGYMLKIDKNGALLGKYKQPDKVAQFVMSPPVIIDNWVYSGTDGGAYSFIGDFPPLPIPEESDNNKILLLIVFLGIIGAFLIYFLYVKLHLKKPFIAHIRGYWGGRHGAYSGSRIKRNKKRLVWVLALGIILSSFMFIVCLAYGPSGNYPLMETFNILSSAISKGGKGLTPSETIVFVSRMPRALATFAVGIGLSIAGTVYQAIIRNPMVDPYIMGVSAGAGTFAVATISTGFTFFGIFSTVTYSLPLAAMAGGVLAFGITMLIAEKAGGSSTNYVLGGVIDRKSVV